MSETLTPKQKAFTIAVAEGATYSKAYRSAYDAEKMKNEAVWVEASRLMSNPKVSLRVFELQEAAQERCMVTVESLTEELDEDRQLARQEGQASAAVSAVMSKAKLHGLLVEKKQVEHSGVNITIAGDEKGI